jgi:flagellar protein FlgJ
MFAVHDRLAVDVADAQALKAQAARGDHAALAGAAKQFEALLVTQMLKAMRQTRFNEEDDPMNGGESMKLYQDLLDQQWASQLTKGRGLGFAEMMVKAMERQTSGAGGPAGPAPDGKAGPEGGIKEAVTLGDATPARPGDTPSPALQTPFSTGSGTQETDPRRAFLERMKPHAEAAARTTGVPAEFILAHAALESGWGRHEIKDVNGQASHNLFGIKAGRTWDGAVAETLTTEYRDGLPVKLTQRFRAYGDYASAFADYANLLKARFGNALEGRTDAAAFANVLAAGGYATDPAYAGKLQSVIAKVAMSGG